MDLRDVLQILFLIGMLVMLWRALKARRPLIALDGKRYHRLKDGRYCTRWGLIIRDEALIARLRSVDPEEAKHA